LYIFNLYVLRQQTRRQTVLNQTVASITRICKMFVTSSGNEILRRQCRSQTTERGHNFGGITGCILYLRPHPSVTLIFRNMHHFHKQGCSNHDRSVYGFLCLSPLLRTPLFLCGYLHEKAGIVCCLAAIVSKAAKGIYIGPNMGNFPWSFLSKDANNVVKILMSLLSSSITSRHNISVC
jgi:hypothetical protein